MIGQQRAVFWGGVLIMLGNGSLAAGDTQLFFIGLLVIVLGVGLLKPNISAIVAQLYPEGGSRRDAGFSIFYMGINLGAFLGSIFVPITAAAFGWSAGFALPAVGMLFGLVQFQVTKNHLGTSGVVPLGKPATWWPIIGFMIVVVVVAALALSGTLALNPVRISVVANWTMIALAAGYFAYLAVLRRPRDRRAQARDRDDRAVRGVRDVLGGLRADRRVAQPVRRPPHRSHDLRLGDAGRRAAGA